MQSWVLYAGLVLVFVGIVGAVASAGGSERGGVARSLAAVEAIKAAPDSMRQELDPSFSERVVGPAFARLTALGRRFTPNDQSARLRRRLDLAGNPAGWDTDRILAFKMLGLIVGAAVGVLVPLLYGNVAWAVVFGIGLALLGLFLPNIILYQKAYDRSRQIERELPDALDLLVISVEAGLGFDAALSQVARNTTGPLAEEFFRVLQEMQLGTGRADAMRALSDRTDVTDLRALHHRDGAGRLVRHPDRQRPADPGARDADPALAAGRGGGAEGAGQDPLPAHLLHPARALHRHPRPGRHPDHEVVLHVLVRTASVPGTTASGQPPRPRAAHSVNTRESTSCSATSCPLRSKRAWSNRLRNSMSTPAMPPRFFSMVSTAKLRNRSALDDP